MHGLFFNFCLSILLLRAREFQFPHFFLNLQCHIHVSIFAKLNIPCASSIFCPRAYSINPFPRVVIPFTVVQILPFHFLPESLRIAKDSLRHPVLPVEWKYAGSILKLNLGT
ncbi:unnamed protein product [Meloidogyne enterolobii]|uniref:Uncharacterized protein n=1 Tax=Meloidogyne enterolobii TaxID=390850 RepID=A0ACB0XXD1_MELEN